MTELDYCIAEQLCADWTGIGFNTEEEEVYSWEDVCESKN